MLKIIKSLCIFIYLYTGYRDQATFYLWIRGSPALEERANFEVDHSPPSISRLRTNGASLRFPSWILHFYLLCAFITQGLVNHFTLHTHTPDLHVCIYLRQIMYSNTFTCELECSLFTKVLTFIPWNNSKSISAAREKQLVKNSSITLSYLGHTLALWEMFYTSCLTDKEQWLLWQT
jgi:hypothetical protein